MIQTKTDSAGSYETEIFDCPHPKSVIVCVHGRGVRRWDGKHFFRSVADHYPDHTFLLVDQNQFDEAGICYNNPLPIAIRRNQDLIELSESLHSDAPVTLIGHSLGCALITQMDLTNVAKVIFVAPAAGSDKPKMIERFGPDVANGKMAISADGVSRYMSKEYFDSLMDHAWEEEYRDLLNRYKPVYAFESGEEEVVGEERFVHRTLPFRSYKIIPGAKHNFEGEALNRLYVELNDLL